MSTYSFFDSETGRFWKHAYQGPAAYVEANTPAGHTAIAGWVDSMSKRMDFATGEVVDWRPEQPADTDLETYAWDDERRRYIATPTVKARKAAAASAIDAAAGAARLRYITDVPGQQGVYLQKAAEAQAFKDAGYTGDVPPYVQAEADATGLSAQEAADRILTIAAQWGNVLSPAIERARISGKQAVEAATDADGIAAARGSALDSLAGI